MGLTQRNKQKGSPMKFSLPGYDWSHLARRFLPWRQKAEAPEEGLANPRLYQEEWRQRLPFVPAGEVGKRLGFGEALSLPRESLGKSLCAWKMELDDFPILRFLYRNFRPRRHLEFGTWQGAGVCCCLESCEATVWTINLYDGEKKPDGQWAYGEPLPADEVKLLWGERQEATGATVLCRTDSLGFIGRLYHKRNLGHRVCQIYCDSRAWCTRNYPSDFFDSALIDGGHTRELVANDTRKALQVVRAGGLLLWHDFCPDAEVVQNCSSTQGVLAAIKADWDWLQSNLSDLFWIEPSWLLVGIKR